MKLLLPLMALLVLTGSAAAHGDKQHATPRRCDASQVQQTPFGREGDPRRVTNRGAVQFTGEFQFACLVAGHFEAGKAGTVTVK